jgi:hypothetical protein
MGHEQIKSVRRKYSGIPIIAAGPGGSALGSLPAAIAAAKKAAPWLDNTIFKKADTKTSRYNRYRYNPYRYNPYRYNPYNYRRNADKEIRHLERDYAMSGDQETWQRLQHIKDRMRTPCHRCSSLADETISFRKHEYCKPCYQEGVIEDDGMPCDGYEGDCEYEMAYDWQDRDTGEYIMCQRCYQQAVDGAAHEMRVNNEFSHYDDYDYDYQ